MTKRKTAPFHGAWMNRQVPDPLLRKRMSNEADVEIDAAAVIVVLSRQMELWRFNLEWQTTDPEPSQWASLLRAIKVPQSPTRLEVIELRHRVHTSLPAHVIAVLNDVLFRRAEVWTVALFDRMLAGDPASVDVLRVALVDMAESAKLVKGKRGPRLKQDIGPTLRAVHRAILENSQMPDVPARALAADLLRICGIPAPESRSQLAKLLAAPSPD